MSKPIYRYLANEEWRQYRRPLLVQRITQMSVIPDILPHIDPVVDIRLAFGRRTVQPGDFVDSRVSEVLPKLRVQVFDKGERLVSLVVVDPDVPDVESDAFKYRCHFLATNIRISPTETSLPLSKLSSDTQVLLPWLPPFAQKGSPYHRYSIFLLQHSGGNELDVAALRETVQRDGFNLRSFTDKHLLRPVGVHMFRSIWDTGTAGVMKKAGIEGAEVEFKRKKIEPLKKPVLPLPRKKPEPQWKFR
jgi:large subunit ribosomal protein L35